MSKPYVICHMMSSVDGRILLKQWGERKVSYTNTYEETALVHNTNAWLCGRVTMEEGFASKEPLTLKPVSKPVERVDFIAPYKEKSFAIAVDPSGKLNWASSSIDEDHIITVLTTTVSDEYLAFLQEKGISYLFGGEVEIDFNSVFERLFSIFNIKRLLVEGGGNINGSILNAGLIDELSLLSCPVIDGTDNTPTLFDVSGSLPKAPASQLDLFFMEEWEDNVWWIRYKVIK